MLSIVIAICSLVAGIIDGSLTCSLYLVFTLLRCISRPHWAWPVYTIIIAASWLGGLIVFFILPENLDADIYWNLFGYRRDWDWMFVIFLILISVLVVLSAIQMTLAAYGKFSYTHVSVDPEAQIGRLKIYLLFLGIFAACILSPNIFRIPYALFLAGIFLMQAFRQPKKLDAVFEAGLNQLKERDIRPFRIFLLLHSAFHVTTISVLRIDEVSSRFSLESRLFLGVLPVHGNSWSIVDWFLLVAIGIELSLFLLFSPMFRTQTFSSRPQEIPSSSNSFIPLQPLTRAKTDLAPVHNLLKKVKSGPLRISSVRLPSRIGTKKVHRQIRSNDFQSSDLAAQEKKIVDDSKKTYSVEEPEIIIHECNEDVLKSDSFEDSLSPQNLLPMNSQIVRASSAPEKLAHDPTSSMGSQDVRSFSANLSKLFRRALRTFEISICVFALTVVFVIHQQIFNVVLMAIVLSGLLTGTNHFSEIALYILLPLSASVSLCAFIVFSIPWIFMLPDETFKLFGLYNKENSSAFVSIVLFLSPAIITWLYCLSSANKRKATRSTLTAASIITASIEGDEFFLDMALHRDQSLFVKAVDTRGRTALHNAVLHSHVGSVEVILHRGGISLIDVLDFDGRSALELSTQSRITKQMLRYGAHPSDRWEEQQARLKSTTSSKFDIQALKELCLETWSDFERIVKVALMAYGAKIALVCVFFVGFSRIDLLHIGYVLVSLLYVSLPKLSTKREKWLPLAIFSAVALLCQYAVSVIDPHPEGSIGYVFQSIGLVALNPFFPMFFPALLATALCLFQLHFIDEKNRSNWEEMSSAWKSTGIQLVLSLSSVLNNAFLNFGSIIVCFAFFLISFSDVPSVFNFGYLALCITAFLVKSISILNGRSSYYIFWALAVAYTASVVFLKYAVQYTIVSSLVESIIEVLYYPPEAEFRIDINIIGMPIINTTVDSLFFQLFPAIVVFFVTVSFFRIQFFGSSSEGTKTEWMYVLAKIGSKRLSFFANVLAKVVALLPIAAFCLYPSVISLIYIFTACLFMLRADGIRIVWLPELILASIFLLARYLFQIRPVRARWGGILADYFGFNVIYTSLLTSDGLLGELLLLLFIYFQRVLVFLASNAEQLEHEQFILRQMNHEPAVNPDPSVLEQKESSESNISVDSVKAPRLAVEADRFSRIWFFMSYQVAKIFRLIFRNLVSFIDEEFPFSFDIELASLSLFCTIAARRTVASLLIFTTWGCFYTFSRVLRWRFWKLTQLLIFLINLMECLSALGPPPSIVYPIPLPDINDAMKLWLGLSIDYIPNIAFTYISLWLLSMCRFATSHGFQSSSAVSATEILQERRAVFVNLYDSANSQKKFAQSVLPFCPNLLIATIFVASVLYADVSHLILLVIAITLFSTGPFKDSYWSLLRAANYLIFLLLLAYQNPWRVKRDALFSSSIDADLGFRPINSAKGAFSSSGFLTFLIGTLIIDIKKRLDIPAVRNQIEAEYRKWKDLAEIRLNIACVLWNHTRIAEFHSMRRVQEELRHQLRCLLTDTRRLGLEKLQDTEVWPSVPPERTVHFTIDKDKRIIEWNPEASLLTQWNAKDVIGLHAWEIFPRKLSSLIKQMIRKCLRSKSFRDAQGMDSQKLILIKKESRLQVDVDAWLTPLTDADGSLAGIVFFMAPVAVGSIFDATLGVGSQNPLTNVKRAESSDVTNGLIKTDLAAVRISLENDIIDSYSAAFVDLIDAKEYEKSIIGSSLYHYFVKENDRSRLANAIQDMIASGATIQIKNLLASMQTWSMPVDSSNVEELAASPLVFVAEVTITPVENASEELIGLQLCFKRHHVEDLTISFFRSIIAFLKNQMTKHTDNLLFLTLDDSTNFSAAIQSPDKTFQNQEFLDIKSCKSLIGLKFWSVLTRFVVSHTQSVCVSMFLLNLLVNGTLNTLSVPLMLLLFGLFVRPRVPPSLWFASVVYLEVVVFLKVVINFFVDATQFSRNNSKNTILQETQTLGWTQFSGFVNTNQVNLFAFVCLDLLCLFATAVHLHCLKRKGIDFKHNECECESNEDIMPSTIADDDQNNVNLSPSQSKIIDGTDLLSPKSVNFSAHRRTSSEYSLKSQSQSSQFEDKRIEAAGRVLQLLPKRMSTFLTKLLALTPSGATDTSLKPGKSLYIPSFILEMVIALFILFGWNKLTASESNQDQIRSQTFEGAMVGVLFLQILSIVTDRLCFLYRSLMMKLSLHYIQVLFFTYLMFFSWPKNRQYGFSSNSVLIVFFILKCCYWWLSCIQIRSGYPEYSLHHRTIFSRASKTRLYIFKAYRAIPFVAELEVLLDWVSTDTALDLFETFKLEDIYSNLYMIKGDLIYKREHRRGEPFPTLTKFTNGTLLFIGLMIVICIPLLLFSTASPVTNQLNNVQRGSMSLFLTPGSTNNTTAVSFTLLDSSSLSIQDASAQQISQFGSVSDSRTIQNIIANGYSDTPWLLSPPNLESFTNTLTDSISLRFNMRFSFVHQDSRVSEISISNQQEMTQQDKQALYKMLKKQSITPVPIQGKFLPFCLKLSSKVVTPIPFPGDNQNSDLSLQLKSDNNVEWWELRKADGTGMNILTISDTITSGLLAAVIAMSLTTIYVTIVLAVGRFLRSMVQNQVYSIIYTDVHDVTDLMLLCEGIFVARKQKEFELEEALYRSLIRLYRSPDSLIQSTKRREKLKLD